MTISAGKLSTLAKNEKFTDFVTKATPDQSEDVELNGKLYRLRYVQTAPSWLRKILAGFTKSPPAYRFTCERLVSSTPSGKTDPTPLSEKGYLERFFNNLDDFRERVDSRMNRKKTDGTPIPKDDLRFNETRADAIARIANKTKDDEDKMTRMLGYIFKSAQVKGIKSLNTNKVA